MAVAEELRELGAPTSKMSGATLMQSALSAFYPRSWLRGTPRPRTLVIEVSGSQKSPGPTKAKAETARHSWCASVNNHGGFGRWGYIEMTDPLEFKPASAIHVLLVPGGPASTTWGRRCRVATSSSSHSRSHSVSSTSQSTIQAGGAAGGLAAHGPVGAGAAAAGRAARPALTRCRAGLRGGSPRRGEATQETPWAAQLDRV
ncbi:hypothetical protein EFK50_13865 [Nocardioides marmoriginsengisoli]|uniref:Uncharacterized protein n=1 Tax=Nocardioides marmoriginsengisoli TaxID=661483 RepID=A0A3N0CHA1_9ACTN|nr:hypothetical protein EFK50_13865 [Nocardioides marmoriginsengisoli]